ncbi:Chitin synthase, class 5 [Arachnomyces sp. PD_36]|nr:Chitin synthase, class 5 [Arachnomyces sp. PD_36]
MLVSLTVGKVDAGVAVLLTDDNRLIEFPSVLLPKNINSGSIVDITVSRNHSAEANSASSFRSLQKRILNTYGINSPSPPVLRLRNATQTSLVLEWDPINLATASLKSLSLYRNGAKAGSIPRPTEMLSTKISGLAIDTEYTFHLVLRTSAGTFNSEKLTCRTHKMTDLSGITITPGVLPPAIRTSLASAVDRVGAKLIDNVRIDTTHFVCTEGRGPAWEKAVEMNIPVVRPEWIEGCEREGTIVSVRGYYLNADPKTRQIGQAPGPQQPASHVRSASSTVSGDRGSQSNLSPRPGGEGSTMNPLPEVPNGTNTDGESEVPPTPPPKNDTADSKHESSNAGDEDGSDNEDQSQAEGNRPNGSTARSSDSETSQEKDPAGSKEIQGSEKPQSPISDTSVESEKNANGTEGDLDEVPL